jgi:hypothetical protein
VKVRWLPKSDGGDRREKVEIEVKDEEEEEGKAGGMRI